MDEQKLLNTIPFFAEVLNSDDLDRLASAARRTRHEVGSVIIREHDDGESMFAIMSGTVEVSTRRLGRSKQLTTLSSGDIFGEISLLTGARRSATVRAVNAVETLEIDKKALQPIMDASPAAFMEFAMMLIKRRSELDRIHGDGFWNLCGLPRSRLAPTIREFFRR
jgi:CRP-like cAMP-binding protein